jgi:hypothetical protein
MNKHLINQYQQLNDAATMDMRGFIQRIDTTPLGDREAVFERAQKLHRWGVAIPNLLIGLKASLNRR